MIVSSKHAGLLLFLFDYYIEGLNVIVQNKLPLHLLERCLAIFQLNKY